MKRFSTLKNILLFINISFILLLGGYLSYRLYQDLNYTLSEKQENLHKSLKSIIDRTNYVNSIYLTLNLLTINPAIKKLDEKEGTNILRETVKRTDFLYNIAVLDPKGDLIISAVPASKKINAADRLYFKRALEKKAFVSGEFAISRTTGKPTIHFALPILDENHNIKAVLIAVPDKEKIIPDLKNINYPLVIDEFGNIVYSSITDEIGKKFENFNLIENKTESGSFVINKEILSYASLKIDDKPIMYLVSKIPVSTVLSPVYKNFFYESLFIGFFYILIAIFSIYVIVRFINTPFKEIEKALTSFNLEKGGTVIEKKYFGELGLIAEYLNKMAKIIEQDTLELVKEKKFFESTFNATKDLIFVVDNDNNIIRANKAFFDFYKLELAMLGNIKCHKVLHNLDLPIDFCPFKQDLEKDEVYQNEHYFPDLKKWFLLTVTPLYLENNIYGALHILRDITFLKEGEIERRRIETQLLHTQRLESLGILAGGVAHDFNNLLMGILGNTELALMRSDKLPQEVVQNLETIKLITNKAAHLTRQMLAYSGRGKFVLRDIEINKFIKEIYDLIKVSLSKKVSLHINLDESKPLIIKADPGQIEQVLMNLIINANEACLDKEGLITITTGRQWCDKKYFESCIDGFTSNLSEGYYVYIEVTDTGCGVDKETLSKIFEPFFTTKFTGRGLGLSAVLGIIRGHGGLLKVYSEKGKGSSFKIIFPEARVFDQLAEEEKAHIKIYDKTVLVVDDEEMIREVIKKMLESVGAKVLTAADGLEAIEIYKNHCQMIELVLLDLSMPKLKGDEVFREIKKLNDNVKVILMSGYNDQELSQKLVGRGFAGFIQKPFSIKELLKIIE